MAPIALQEDRSIYTYLYYIPAVFILTILAISRCIKKRSNVVIPAQKASVYPKSKDQQSYNPTRSSKTIQGTQEPVDRGDPDEPSPLQLHLKSLYEGLPGPVYHDHGAILRTSPMPPFINWGQVTFRLLQQTGILDPEVRNGLSTERRSFKKAREIAEAYVGLHWEWQEYGAPNEVFEAKIDRWVQDLLSRNVARVVGDSQGRKKKRIIGLDDINVSGKEYLSDLRTFRDEMNARKTFWRQKLLKKKLVLASDPRAGSSKTITFEELPQGVENCRIAAHNTPRVPLDYNFRAHRLRMRLNKRDVIVQVEIG